MVIPTPFREDHLAGTSAPRRRAVRRVARKTIAVLPTLLTLGNLLAGFVAVFLASRPQVTPMPWGWTPLTFAAIFVFVGMALDGLDGRIARLTRSNSDLGEQLDSMADMVTFGVAPAFIAVQLVGIQTPFLSESADSVADPFYLTLYFGRFTLIVAAIYVMCVAMRLARFNLEVKNAAGPDHLSFRGLPSPGAAGTVGSLVLLHEHFLASDKSTTAAKVGMVLIMGLVAWAMVSHLSYMHVLNRYIRNRVPFGKLVLFVAVLALLVVYPQISIASAFVIYALSAPTLALWKRSDR